jgi:hypothetical protein
MEQHGGIQQTLSTAFLGGGKLTAPWAAAMAAQTANTASFISQNEQASFFPNEAGYIVLEVFKLEVFLLVLCTPLVFGPSLALAVLLGAGVPAPLPVAARCVRAAS